MLDWDAIAKTTAVLCDASDEKQDYFVSHFSIVETQNAVTRNYDEHECKIVKESSRSLNHQSERQSSTACNKLLLDIPDINRSAFTKPLVLDDAAKHEQNVNPANQTRN